MRRVGDTAQTLQFLFRLDYFHIHTFKVYYCSQPSAARFPTTDGFTVMQPHHATFSLFCPFCIRKEKSKQILLVLLRPFIGYESHLL